MRWLVLIAVVLLVSCTSGGSGAQDADTAVRSALDVLTAGINSENAILASEPIGDDFFLGANVGSRFTADAWDTNAGTPAVGRFRTFFDNAFTHLANSRIEFAVGSVDVNGEIADVNVNTRFDAVLTDTTPSENVTYSTTDYMLFKLQNGSWRLVRWDEQSASGPTPGT